MPIKKVRIEMKLNLNLQFLTSPHHKSIILIRKSVISLKKFPSLIIYLFFYQGAPHAYQYMLSFKCSKIS